MIYIFDWLGDFIGGIGSAIGGVFDYLGEQISNAIWNTMLQWFYETIYNAVADFFTMMGNMGADVFDLEWVQATINLFTLFGWALFVAGTVVAVFDVAIEYQNGRANIKTTAINVLKGFFACSLFGVVPVELYKFCISLQNTFSKDLSSIMAGQQSLNLAGQSTSVLEGSFAVSVQVNFGSGYSSLNVLKDIVVDVLKMDMKFFAGDDREGRGENIMAAVIRMAKWLNMPVVAEGVERIEQVEFLRSIGCEYVQGYYFAKPMPVEEYEKLQFDRPHAERKKETERLVDIDSLWTPASQLESLFLNAKQGVAVYEYGKEQIEIIRVNNAYYEVFGYQDISQKKDIFQGIPKRYHKRILDAFFYTADKGRETQCEFSRKNEAGEEIFISLKLYDVGIVGNKHIIYGVFLNVTEPKQLEWELEKYRLLLSGKTKDREMEQEKEQSEE